MSEPCENCRTPVSVIDQRAVWSILGAADVSDLPGPTIYEQYSASSAPGSVSIEQIRHTPDRCREARRQQETR